MPEVVVASPDRSAAMSGGTPAWISLALGLCIFGLLFAIASVIVLSLIPVYLATKSVTVSNTASVTNSLSPTFSSSWSPSSSSVSASNTASIARQLESAAGLSSGTLTVNSATATTSSSSSSGRRRRQDSPDPTNLPPCNGSSENPTNIGFDISVNYSSCNKKALSKQESCKTDLYNLVKSKLDNMGPISFDFQLSDGSTARVAAKRCRKFPGAPPGIPSSSLPPSSLPSSSLSPPTTNSCINCTITINTGINNFFIGAPNATNLTSIYTGNGTISSNTTYVGYPSSAFSGSCLDLCRTINTVCDSDYALCSLDVSNYGVCSIVASGGTCPGISIYNDPNGRTGSNPDSPVTCSGSSNYCCCVPRT